MKKQNHHCDACKQPLVTEPGTLDGGPLSAEDVRLINRGKDGLTTHHLNGMTLDSQGHASHRGKQPEVRKLTDPRGKLRAKQTET